MIHFDTRHEARNAAIKQSAATPNTTILVLETFPPGWATIEFTESFSGAFVRFAYRNGRAIDLLVKVAA